MATDGSCPSSAPVSRKRTGWLGSSAQASTAGQGPKPSSIVTCPAPGRISLSRPSGPPYSASAVPSVLYGSSAEATSRTGARDDSHTDAGSSGARKPAISAYDEVTAGLGGATSSTRSAGGSTSPRSAACSQSRQDRLCATTTRSPSPICRHSPAKTSSQSSRTGWSGAGSCG